MWWRYRVTPCEALRYKRVCPQGLAQSELGYSCIRRNRSICNNAWNDHDPYLLVRSFFIYAVPSAVPTLKHHTSLICLQWFRSTSVTSSPSLVRDSPYQKADPLIETKVQAHQEKKEVLIVPPLLHFMEMLFISTHHCTQPVCIWCKAGNSNVSSAVAKIKSINQYWC